MITFWLLGMRLCQTSHQTMIRRASAVPSAHAVKPALVCAVQPEFNVFDAYNVGWSLSDKKRTARRLGEELVELWHDHEFHAMGLSEIYEVEYKDAATRNEVMIKRERIRDVLLGMLTKASSRQWCARLDAHHMYIYQESLNCVQQDYVSLGVASQPWRKVQYFVFLPPGCDLPLHVYHLTRSLLCWHSKTFAVNC